MHNFNISEQHSFFPFSPDILKTINRKKVLEDESPVSQPESILPAAFTFSCFLRAFFLGSCTGSGAVTPCLSPPACAVRVFPGRPGLLHGPLWRRRTMLRVGLPWPGLLLCVFLGGCSSISVWRVKLGGSL